MNYWDGQQWLPSQPTFSTTLQGFFAGKVQHKIQLASDINVEGAVGVLTPDGLAVRSSPVAIAIYDPVDGSSLLIGVITNSQGELLNDSQVIYPEAFQGVCANVVYSLDRSSFAQDVEFTGRVVPADYGFPTNHPVRLQIWTEFYGIPVPDILKQPIYIEQDPVVRSRMVSPDLVDQSIGFGEYVLGHGYAYTAPTAAQAAGMAGLVAKEMVQTSDHRVFLIESVNYESIAKGLESLPQCAPAEGTARHVPKLSRDGFMAAIPSLPNKIESKASPRLAVKESKSKVTIDYIATIGTTLNGATVFQSSTNWFVSGTVNCNGQVTIEGGTVFKFQTNASLHVNNALICKGSMYRPIYFTGVDDDTVGDSLNGWPGANWTGHLLTTGYANPAIYMGQSSLTLSNCFFRYAQQAIRYVNLGQNANLNITHSQLVKCIRGIELDTSGCGSGGSFALMVNLNNVLMSGVQNPVVISGFPFPITCQAFNCTVDQVGQIVSGSFGSTVWYNSYNSIYANVTNAMSGVGTASGTNNGFYIAPPIGSGAITSSVPPFQTVGSSTHYLTNTSNFHNAGTTNRLLASYPPGLISDLRLRTTYPPVVWAQLALSTNVTLTPQASRDVGPSNLDLGYHFDPIDYSFGNVTLSNATISAYGGTVLGTFNSPGGSFGLGVTAGGQFRSTGASTNRNWIVRYNTVQEQAVTNWSGLPVASALVALPATNTPCLLISCRFTDFSVPSQDGFAFFGSTNTETLFPITFQDCQFHNGKLSTIYPSLNLLNNLFERVTITLSNRDLGVPILRNNLFWNGLLNLSFNSATNGVIRENLFDGTAILDSGNTYTAGYNGFLTNAAKLATTNATDVFLTNSPSYQNGALGVYYLPTTSPLLHAGSQTADSSGLFWYCITTNQTPETNSTVSIGYHYPVPGLFQSTIDSDGDGLPDWWEIQYGLDPNNPDTGNSGVQDGYKQDSVGDGWDNLQKFQMGVPPNVFATPPSPQGLSVSAVSGGGGSTLTWQTNAYPPTSYMIVRYEGNLAYSTNFVAASQSTFTDVSWSPDAATTYTIAAIYSGGSSFQSTMQDPIVDPNYSVEAQIVRGPGGALYLVASAIPQSITGIRVSYDGGTAEYPISSIGQTFQIYTPPITSSGSPFSDHFDVPVSSFTNGIYQIPYSQLSAYGSYEVIIQGVGANGKLGSSQFGDPHSVLNIPFLDGRQHIKTNINFLLQAPNAAFPFSCYISQSSNDCDHSYYHIGATNYVYSGYFVYDDYAGEYLDEFWPFEDNYLYANFTYPNRGNIHYDNYSACFDGFLGPWIVLSGSSLFGEFNFVPSTNTPPLAPNWAQSSSQWSISGDGEIAYDDTAWSGFYVDPNNSQNRVLSTSAANFYGLPFKTILTSNITVNPGNSVPLVDFQSTYVFQQIAQPVLTTTSYYFARPNLDPIPGDPEFTTNCVTPSMFLIPFGQAFVITAWAKQTVSNGSLSVCAYTQQYFDKAFIADANGNITTNQTGILSEYGEFFPTQPGKVFLTTKPDGATGSTGQCVVYVVKLQLDVNHDGAMDLSYAGPDNSPYDRPFLFWVNDDTDMASGTPGSVDEDVNWPTLPDWACGAMTSQRDLEDYARVWIVGLPALWASNGYALSLSWDHVVSGHPSIELFKAVETNGGTRYLTDSSTAAAQVSWPIAGSFGTVSNTFNFPNNFFTNYASRFFLFEGAGAGKGRLVLSISQNGTNVLATFASIDLEEVKELFEHANVENVTSGNPPSSLVSQISIKKVLPTDPKEVKALIVLVHGMNITPWQYENDSETFFKRLYWAGYRGRFASVEWPCGYLPYNTANPFNYNLSEFYAWKSAAGVKAYLDYLRTSTRLTDYKINILAHSQGNVVVSEALEQGAPFDNYILSQAAVPAHCFDTNTNNVPFLGKLLAAEASVPTPFFTTNGGYQGYFTNLGGGTNNIVNFFNTNDYALISGTVLWGYLVVHWEKDQQITKPDGFVAGPIYGYNPSGFKTTRYDILGNGTTVTDLQEIRGLVARSRSHAIGAQIGARGAISSSVDLFQSFGFGNTRPDHSGQCTRDIQAAIGYYNQVLSSFGIQQ
jgi:hypothetical protein